MGGEVFFEVMLVGGVNICCWGEDIVEGDMFVCVGMIVELCYIGLLVVNGIMVVDVWWKICIVIFFIGNELMCDGLFGGVVVIYDVNGLMFVVLCSGVMFDMYDFGVFFDDLIVMIVVFCVMVG